MSDSIIRWWPKSQCTMSIASMDEAHAAIAARLKTHENIAANLRNDFRECALRAEKAEARLAEAHALICQVVARLNMGQPVELETHYNLRVWLHDHAERATDSAEPAPKDGDLIVGDMAYDD